MTTLLTLPDAAITLQAAADDWRGAVRLASDALTRSGVAKPGYGDEMIRMVEEHGPYVVIAPGLALAHARPGPDVLGDGLAVVTLETPVAFGHPHNDPVRVVIGLAVHDSERHLPLIAELANALDSTEVVDHLADAATPDAVRTILGRHAA